MIGLQSELLKYKRTFTQKLILFFPLFFVLQALPQKLFMPADYLRPWQLVINLVFNWWPLIFLPLGIALFAILVDAQERKAGNYRSLCAHKTSPMYIWINKVLGMALYTLLATLVLVVSVVLAGLVTAKGAVPWTEILTAGLVTWITSLTFIPIQLWVTTWKGIFPGMGVGFFGMIVGIVAATKPYWIVVPWSWPIRLMAPIIGVHPNGLTLEVSDPLREASVIPIGILVSILVFIVITAISAVWFKKREVK